MYMARGRPPCLGPMWALCGPTPRCFDFVLVRKGRVLVLGVLLLCLVLDSSKIYIGIIAVHHMRGSHLLSDLEPYRGPMVEKLWPGPWQGHHDAS